MQLSFLIQVILVLGGLRTTEGCGGGMPADTCWAAPVVMGPDCPSHTSLFGSPKVYITYQIRVEGGTNVMCEGKGCGSGNCCSKWGFYGLGLFRGGGQGGQSSLPWGNSAATPTIRCQGLPLGSAITWTWTTFQSKNAIPDCNVTTTAASTTPQTTYTTPYSPSTTYSSSTTTYSSTTTTTYSSSTTPYSPSTSTNPTETTTMETTTPGTTTPETTTPETTPQETTTMETTTPVTTTPETTTPGTTTPGATTPETTTYETIPPEYTTYGTKTQQPTIFV